MGYLEEITNGLWAYRLRRFSGQDHLFDLEYTQSKGQPPVFLSKYENFNIISCEGYQSKLVRAEIPQKKRHRWFRSMKSSQALAQSVFSNLKHLGNFHLLQGIRTHDDDIPVFEDIDDHTEMEMEWEVDFLNEPSKTSIDVAFFQEHRIAIECKLTELDIGCCSRPDLYPQDKDYCDGAYRYQQGRMDRCSLTSIGIKYWQFIPLLFEWSSDRDYNPCPLKDNYQLVRNILAASIKNEVVDQRAMVVMVFDERNPKYIPGGGGVVDKKFTEARKALRIPRMLQRISWQSIVKELEQDHSLKWLTEGMHDKYGL